MKASFIAAALTLAASAHASPLGLYSPDVSGPIERVAPDGDWNSIFVTNAPKLTTFGVSFTGAQTWALNDSLPMIPASVTKIFIAGAVLDKISSDFTFTTRASWTTMNDGTATDLLVTADGDPSPGFAGLGIDTRSDIAAFAKKLADAGLKKVSGKIRIESADARWDRLKIPNTWPMRYRTACMATIGHAFNLEGNCGTLEIRGTNTAVWITPGVSTPVTLKLSPGTKTNLLVTPQISGSTDQYSVVVSGTFAKAARIDLPVHDTKGWYKNLLVSALKKLGVTFVQKQNPDAKAIRSDVVESHSQPLSAILAQYLKESRNFIGETLIQLLGAQAPDDGRPLLLNGLDLLNDFIARTTTYHNELVFHDGCGLSYENSVTPRATLDVLTHYRDEKWFPVFWNSLTIAGVDGTLKDRMKDSPAQGTLRGKTGTLTGVSNLVGYVPDTTNKDISLGTLLPFVMLGESTTATTEQLHAIQNRAGIKLSTP